MSFDLTRLNLLAVFVAAVAAFVVGGMWYAVLFGRPWARVYGYTEAQLQEMSKNPGRTFPLIFLCDVVMALAVAVLVVNLNLTSVLSGAVLGAALWLGVAGANGLALQLGHGRPLAGWIIDTGQQLVALLVCGMILSVWR